VYPDLTGYEVPTEQGRSGTGRIDTVIGGNIGINPRPKHVGYYQTVLGPLVIIDLPYDKQTQYQARMSAITSSSVNHTVVRKKIKQ